MEMGELVLIAARQVGVSVEFRLEVDALVLIDRIQIQQVLINLMRNVVEAMADAPSRELCVSTGGSGDYIVTSIIDSGPGRPPEVAAHLFQPFVTTKSDGMGVGLSICRTIIAQHGGERWLDTGARRGVTFRFKLPVARDGARG